MNQNKLHGYRKCGLRIALLYSLFFIVYAGTAQAAPDPVESLFHFSDHARSIDFTTSATGNAPFLLLASRDEDEDEEDRKRERDGDEDKDEGEDEAKKEDDDDDDDDEQPSVVSDNIIAIHDRNSPQYNKNCSDCHADIRTRVSLNPGIPDAHVAMLPFSAGEPGDDLQCAWCHRTVDLIQAAATPVDARASLRKHVDARMCALCHGPAGPGTQFYQVNLSNLQPSGPLLYDLVCSGCHLPIANSEVRGESAREINEAILENEGGMAPLNVLTQGDIQAIADALAQ